MSYFGASSSIGLCSSHIHSNPVTIAAIKRQQEKERARAQSPQPPADTGINRWLARQEAEKQRAADLALREETFRMEFLYMITALRMSEVVKAKMLLETYNYEVIAPVTHLTMPPVRANAESIIRFHAFKSPFTYHDIIGPDRTMEVVRVRHEAMADVYRQCPHLSLPAIGRKFGGRDHTTVLHALVKLGAVKREYRSDKGLPHQLSQAA